MTNIAADDGDSKQLELAREFQKLGIRAQQLAQRWRTLGAFYQAHCLAQAQRIEAHSVQPDEAELARLAEELERLEDGFHRKRHANGVVTPENYACLWAVCEIAAGVDWIKRSDAKFHELSEQARFIALRVTAARKSVVFRRLKAQLEKQDPERARRLRLDQVPWARQHGAKVAEIVARQIAANTRHVPELKSLPVAAWVDILVRWRGVEEQSSRRALYEFFVRHGLTAASSTENLMKGLRKAALTARLGLGPLGIDPQR